MFDSLKIGEQPKVIEADTRRSPIAFLGFPGTNWVLESVIAVAIVA